MKGIATAALAAIVIAGCATQMQSSVDSDLTEQVRAALNADHLSEVKATVWHGVATLTGTVDDEAARQEAQIDAERVDGLRGVANRIQVRRR